MLSLFHDDLTTVSPISALIVLVLLLIVFLIVTAYYFGYRHKPKTYKIKLRYAGGFFLALLVTVVVSLIALRVLHAKYELGMIVELPPKSVLAAFEPHFPIAESKTWYLHVDASQADIRDFYRIPSNLPEWIPYEHLDIPLFKNGHKFLRIGTFKDSAKTYLEIRVSSNPKLLMYDAEKRRNYGIGSLCKSDLTNDSGVRSGVCHIYAEHVARERKSAFRIARKSVTVLAPISILLAIMLAVWEFLQDPVPRAQRTAQRRDRRRRSFWKIIHKNAPLWMFGTSNKEDFRWYLYERTSRVSARNINEVCDFLLRCEYVLDIVLHNKQDHWQHPTEFEQLQKGDCEDFALWAWRKLVEMGMQAEFMVGKWVQNGQPGTHAWVVFSHNGKPYILESVARKKERMVLPLEEGFGVYIPFVSVDRKLKRKLYLGMIFWLNALIELRKNKQSAPGAPMDTRRSD